MKRGRPQSDNHLQVKKYNVKGNSTIYYNRWVVSVYNHASHYLSSWRGCQFDVKGNLLMLVEDDNGYYIKRKGELCIITTQKDYSIPTGWYMFEAHVQSEDGYGALVFRRIVDIKDIEE